MNEIRKLRFRALSFLLTFSILTSYLCGDAVVKADAAVADSGHPAPIVYDSGTPEQVAMHKTVDSGADRVFNIHLGVEAKKEIVSEKVPCDIVLVLDRSGSMENSPHMPVSYAKENHPDTDKTYYIYVNNVPTEVRYNNGKRAWYYGRDRYKVYVTSRPDGDGTDNAYQFYRQIYKKIDVLKEAAKSFADQVAVASPDSRIGVVQFSSDNSSDTKVITKRGGRNLLKVGNSDSLKTIESAIDGMKAQGATAADAGFLTAKNLLDNPSAFEKVDTETNRKNIVVFFTDGEPNHSNGFDERVASDTVDTAYELKTDNDATIYSIGVFNGITGDNLKKVTDFMNDVASPKDGASGEKLYYPVSSMDEMEEAFDVVEGTVGGLAGVEVRDYIDSRFTLVKNTLPHGATAHTDEHGDYVSWFGLTIDENHLFSKTVQVRAKNSTGGPEYIPTNLTEYSGVYSNGELQYNFPEPLVQIDRVPATDGLAVSKNSSLRNWDDRTYDIRMTATAPTETEEIKPDPCDIVLVLDRSASMLWHMYSPENNPDPSKSYYIYRTDTSAATEGPYQEVSYYQSDFWNSRYSSGWYYKANGWQKVNPTEGGTGEGGDYQFYTQSAQTKLDSLKTAAKNFVDNVKSKSPDSRVAVVSFATDVTDDTNGLVSVIDGSSAIISAIDSIRPYGGTRSYFGMKKAREIFDNDRVDRTGRNRMVVMFTDGEPGDYGFINYTGCQAAASTINESAVLKADNGVHTYSDVEFGGQKYMPASGYGCGAAVYSVGVFSGLGSERLALVEDYMNQVASYKEDSTTEKRYYPASDETALLEAFESISQEVGGISNATVTDVIDPRFDLLDANGKELSKNETHAVYGGSASCSSGVWKITWNTAIGTGTWDGDTMTAPGWQQSIRIKAKPEFIGGNDIPTNVPSVSRVAVGKDSKLFGEEAPTVNVKPMFYIGNRTATIFYGETVPAATMQPYTVEGKDMFCGKSATGTFHYQWLKADGTALNTASDSAVFPDGQILDDSSHYKLAAVFTPSSDGEDSRENCIDEAHSQGRVATAVSNITNPNDAAAPNGIYTVNVVKGRLNINKTITNPYPASDEVKAKQSFVFRIERRNEKTGPVIDTFYEVITLSGDSLSEDKTITGLKKGYYTVTEETGNAWRYSQTSVIDNDVASGDYTSTANDGLMYIGRETAPTAPDGKAYYGADANNCGVAQNPANIAFTNQLVNGHWLSDTTVKVNTVQQG